MRDACTSSLCSKSILVCSQGQPWTSQGTLELVGLCFSHFRMNINMYAMKRFREDRRTYVELYSKMLNKPGAKKLDAADKKTLEVPLYFEHELNIYSCTALIWKETHGE